MLTYVLLRCNLMLYYVRKWSEVNAFRRHVNSVECNVTVAPQGQLLLLLGDKSSPVNLTMPGSTFVPLEGWSLWIGTQCVSLVGFTCTDESFTRLKHKSHAPVACRFCRFVQKNQCHHNQQCNDNKVLCFTCISSSLLLISVVFVIHSYCVCV